MNSVLKRPPATFGAGAGLFRNDHFQIAYATTDMDRALALFEERYGMTEFSKLGGPTPSGGQVRMEIAWAGGVMYELLWAEGPGTEVFRAGLPSEGFAIRQHHLGYRVADAAGWEAILEEIKTKDLKLLHSTEVPGFLKAIIVEDPDLGHFLEYILTEPAGAAFFEQAPGN